MVVEGLDGCGKSTLASSLAAALGARHAASPPASLAALRPLWKAPGPARAFYVCGNYLAADELGRAAAADGRPTVVRAI